MTAPVKKQQDEIKIIANGGLGDCLLLTPFVRYFKEIAEYKRVVVITNTVAKALFETNPFVDLVIPCSDNDLFLWGLPETGCDIFAPYVEIAFASDAGLSVPKIKTEPKLRANLLDIPVVRQIAEAHQLTLENERPELFLTDEEINWAQACLEKFQTKPILLINPATQLSEKRYPLEKWQLAVNQLCETYHLLEISSEFSQLKNVTHLTPLPGIRQSAAIFKLVDCVITLDSFQSHLAHWIYVIFSRTKNLN